MQFPIIGSSVLYLESCDSTNTELARISGNPDTMNGSVVLAFEQTAGKGQRGNIWKNEPHKDLTFSFLINKPDIRSEFVFYPLAATALGVYHFLSKRLPHKKVEIKWPNDVLVNGNKICGMLLENTFSGNQISKMIIGIGLNVNGKNYPDTRFPATSLVLEGEPETPPEDILLQLIPHLNAAFDKLRENPGFLLNAYNQVLFGKHHDVSIQEQDSITRARIERVDSKGILHLINQDGKKIEAGMGEIKFLPD